MSTLSGPWLFLSKEKGAWLIRLVLEKSRRIQLLLDVGSFFVMYYNSSKRVVVFLGHMHLHIYSCWHSNRYLEKILAYKLLLQWSRPFIEKLKNVIMPPRISQILTIMTSKTSTRKTVMWFLVLCMFQYNIVGVEINKFPQQREVVVQRNGRSKIALVACIQSSIINSINVQFNMYVSMLWRYSMCTSTIYHNKEKYIRKYVENLKE